MLSNENFKNKSEAHVASEARACNFPKSRFKGYLKRKKVNTWQKLNF
jgi:hypothetical protein